MSRDGCTVLVVDDEPQITRALRVVLREAGFETVTAASVEQALDVAAVHAPDAAIVDLMLPDGSGVEVCKGLREWSQLPILVLSAVDDEDAKVNALQAGADDYITKPFGQLELIARLEAVLRRAGSEISKPVLKFGELEINTADRSVSRAGECINLTKIEFALLRQFTQNPGKLLTHQALLLEVWGAAYSDDNATLRTHIANLRRKIEDPSAARLIRTETGVGYRFVGK